MESKQFFYGGLDNNFQEANLPVNSYFYSDQFFKCYANPISNSITVSQYQLVYRALVFA